MTSRVRPRRSAGDLLRARTMAARRPSSFGDDWQQLSEYFESVAVRTSAAGRDDLNVFVTPDAVTLHVGAEKNAPGVFLPAHARIAIDGRALPVRPDRLNADNQEHFQAMCALLGVLKHEVGHADHSESMGQGIYSDEVLRLLEEIRMESHRIRDVPGDSRWLRAAAKHHILADIDDQLEQLNRPGVAGTLTLLMGRVIAGSLLPEDVAPVRQVLEAAFGDDVSDLYQLLHETAAVADGDVDALEALADRFRALIKEDEQHGGGGDDSAMSDDNAGQDDAQKNSGSGTAEAGDDLTDNDDQGSGSGSGSGEDGDQDGSGSGSGEDGDQDGSGAAPSEDGDQDGSGAAPSEDGDQDGSGAAPSEDGDQLSQLKQQIGDALQGAQDDAYEKLADDLEASEAIDDAIDQASNSNGSSWSFEGEQSGAGTSSPMVRRDDLNAFSHRAPTAQERRLASKLAQRLMRVKQSSPVRARRASVVPPGRMDGRAQVAATVQREQGRVVTATPWRSRRLTEDPKLRVGVICDVSGSMRHSLPAVSSVTWVLSEAVRRVDGLVAGYSFGDGISTVYPAGDRRKNIVRAFRGEGSTIDPGAAINRAVEDLRLDEDGPRLLVIISDGQWFGSAELSVNADHLIMDLMRRGVAVMTVNADGSMKPHPCSEQVDVPDLEDLPQVLGSAVERTFRRSIV